MSAAESMVYLDVRKKIVEGVYGGGTHLTAEGLATTLGVSRTPVREALRRLHAEGLVSLIANRGAFVTAWTRKDVDEVFDLRVILESHAARLAAQRIVPEALDRLRDLAGRMEHAVRARSAQQLDALTALNAEFHRLILTEAAQRRLMLILGHIVEMPLVMRTFAIYREEELARSMEHHRELIAAFDARDSAWAGSVMQSHLYAAHQVLLRSHDKPAAEPAAARTAKTDPAPPPSRQARRGRPSKRG